MNMKTIFDGVLKEVKPSVSEVKEINNKLKVFLSDLKREIGRQRLKADVFVGGSFAKGTLMKKTEYDIDIYVRFSNTDKVSDVLERVVRKICKNYERVHGSRDYFKYFVSSGMVFEIIPVLKIKNVKHAENVTDLSYFHVSYVKRRTAKISDEILLAKQFCEACGVYGAESYIKGFSGYGLECLLIHYKKFEKMLRELVKVKKGERLVIDIEKKYKNKNAVFIEMNEAKLDAPIVLIDPTFAERNALAALSWDSFLKFQERAREFLKSPRASFFEEKKFDVDKMSSDAKKKGAEFVSVKLMTDRQEGDIAGTKMKKFHYYIEREIEKYFDVIGSHFVYEGGRESVFYMSVKSKKEIVRTGPPIKMEKEVVAFKKVNKNVFVKGDRLYARVKVDFTAREFLQKFSKDKKKLNEMAIVAMSV